MTLSKEEQELILNNRKAAEAKAREEAESVCENCLDKINAIPLKDRLITAVATKEGVHVALSGANNRDRTQFALELLKSTLNDLKENEKLMASIALAVMLKDVLND